MKDVTFPGQFADTAVGFDYVSQLIHPPATSLAAFERVRRGQPVGDGVLWYPAGRGPQPEPVPSLAKLARPYWLNDSAVCLGFPNEEGRFDVLRCHWSVDSWTLAYAEHEFVWSLRVQGPGLETRTVDTVRRVADAVFVGGEGVPAAGIAFKLVGDDGRVLFGGHDTSVRKGRLNNWRDDIIWYHDGEAVGFVSFEANYNMEFFDVDEQRMRSWLKPYYVSFFWPDMLDLISPPADQLEALAAAARGLETPGVAHRNGADPRIENFALLSARFRVPSDCDCLLFHPSGSSSESAITRCRYELDGWSIEQAAGAGRAMWVWGVIEPQDALARAESVAAQLFAAPVRLQSFGEYDGRVFGTSRATADDPAAVRTLRWWVEGDVVGFVCEQVD